MPLGELEPRVSVIYRYSPWLDEQTICRPIQRPLELVERAKLKLFARLELDITALFELRYCQSVGSIVAQHCHSSVDGEPPPQDLNQRHTWR